MARRAGLFCVAELGVHAIYVPKISLRCYTPNQVSAKACAIGLLSSAILFGCVSRQDQFADPPTEARAQVEALAPLVIEYVRRTEANGLSVGVPLSVSERAVAKEVGVTHPEIVRVVYTENLPQPTEPALVEAAARFGYTSPPMVAYTFGHAIFILTTHRGNTECLAHELAHVGQFENLGIDALMRRYFLELMIVGYRASPLEVEAREKARLSVQK